MIEDENARGPRTIITISGIPKNDDPIRMLRVIDDIAEAIGEKMSHVEVGMATGAPDETLEKNLNAEMLSELRGYKFHDGTQFSMLMRAEIASGLISTVAERISDEQSEVNWEAKSEEEKEAIHAHYRQLAEEGRRECVKRLKEQRTREVRQVFDIANQWATEPDLNPMERCHGVAHDIYTIYGINQRPYKGPNGQTRVDPAEQEAFPVNAGKAYSQHYDTHLSEQIRQNQIRAAKALFGD